MGADNGCELDVEDKALLDRVFSAREERRLVAARDEMRNQS